MTRKEVILKAIEGRITWVQAAEVLGMSARHMRRLKARYEKYGFGGLRDGRSGRPRRKRIPTKTIQTLCRLRRETYMDFSVKHFHEVVTEKHGLRLSYTWTRLVLQEAGLAEKAPSRGTYRRRCERRPMRGMLVHLDASTHPWIAGLAPHDLMVALDDADGRILAAHFVPQEGTASTFQALHTVLTKHGRFAALYTDRGSHFCRTAEAGAAPADVQDGQVARALNALGIRHILARSPQARGRSERAFGTLQGRLPQELRVAGIRSYTEAQRYLDRTFVPAFNRRFTVTPTEPESAFVPLAGVDLDLLLSVQHERIVRNDHTVAFRRLLLQLPQGRDRLHYVRCPVLVHELAAGVLAVTYQGRLLARFDPDGVLLTSKPQPKTKNLYSSPTGHL